MQAIGYRANAVQSDTTLASMRLVMMGLPMAFAVAAGALIAFHLIDAPKHAQLLSAIDWRRRRRSDRILARIGQPLV